MMNFILNIWNIQWSPYIFNCELKRGSINFLGLFLGVPSKLEEGEVPSSEYVGRIVNFCMNGSKNKENLILGLKRLDLKLTQILD